VTRRAASAGALLVALVLGCAHLAPRAGRIAECPGALRPTQEIEGDLRLESRMRIRAGPTEVALRLALEKRGPRLVLVGLDPLGVVVFSVVQTGVDVEVEALPPAAFPVPAINVLRDMHRARFLTAGAPPDASGHASSVRDGVRIDEQWVAGTLVLRRFTREREPDAGEVRVEFSGPGPDGVTRARIENGWCGYSAWLDTFSQASRP
jgi:Protein of unknown function (DUF3261)